MKESREEKVCYCHRSSVRPNLKTKPLRWSESEKEREREWGQSPLNGRTTNAQCCRSLTRRKWKHFGRRRRSQDTRRAFLRDDDTFTHRGFWWANGQSGIVMPCSNSPGTTNPPNRIHMEAMSEPNASMKPTKSQTRAPARRDNVGAGLHVSASRILVRTKVSKVAC